MIVLDENLPLEQRELLRAWRVRFRHVGTDVGSAGMTDENIIPLLRKLRPSTLFTRDLGLYRRELQDSKYSIACLAVREVETALFIRRFLAHPWFQHQARRLGHLYCVSFDAIRMWAPLAARETRVPWPPRR